MKVKSITVAASSRRLRPDEMDVAVSASVPLTVIEDLNDALEIAAGSLGDWTDLAEAGAEFMIDEGRTPGFLEAITDALPRLRQNVPKNAGLAISVGVTGECCDVEKKCSNCGEIHFLWRDHTYYHETSQFYKNRVETPMTTGAHVVRGMSSAVRNALAFFTCKKDSNDPPEWL